MQKFNYIIVWRNLFGTLNSPLLKSEDELNRRIKFIEVMFVTDVIAIWRVKYRSSTIEERLAERVGLIGGICSTEAYQKMYAMAKECKEKWINSFYE